MNVSDSTRAFAIAAAGAQTAAPAATDPQAADGAADLGYRSPFEGYQRFTQEQAGSRKATNDNLGRKCSAARLRQSLT
ncbi:hypothetical protein [Hydrogenophaga sp.]|uniref:hypothetical protein n=1 Tax=Hydrogenophaga sp. TaxID=1904254 RepID=UPI002FCB6D95